MENRWNIITVYSQNIEETMEIITEYIQEEKEEHLVIGGDYNARTGNRGGPIREDKEKKKRENLETQETR